MGTHLRMNTQVLSGAQSQPQKWQLLTLLFLIEVEQLSKFLNHLCQKRREGELGLTESTRPQPPKHHPQAAMATTGGPAKSGESEEALALALAHLLNLRHSPRAVDEFSHLQWICLRTTKDSAHPALSLFPFHRPSGPLTRWYAMIRANRDTVFPVPEGISRTPWPCVLG